jgi:hypothetical protein
MYRFLHIGLTFAGVPKIRDLELPMTSVGDWVRYSAMSWLVWTDKTPMDVFSILRPNLDAGDQILIVKIDLRDSFGSVSPWIWEWINSKHSGPAIVTGQTLGDVIRRALEESRNDKPG